MIDDKQTPDGAENADTTSDRSHRAMPLTEFSEPTEASVEQPTDHEADGGADRSQTSSDEGARLEPTSSDEVQPPVLPFETIRDTKKVRRPARPKKEPPTPEEKALKWLENAAHLVRELPHDPRWPVSTGDLSLRARLWVVRDSLDVFTKKSPKTFCLAHPGPSAQELYSLFGQVVGAIRECKDTTEELPKIWGEWSAGRRETVLQRLLELAETREAKLPEPSELVFAGRMSPSRVDAGMASVARELHGHLAQ